MNFEINSTNPAVRSIVSGIAPRPAQLAAARGALPLPQSDLLETLVALAAKTDDAELSAAARQTLAAQDLSDIEAIVKLEEIAPSVLNFFVERDNLPPKIFESILANPRTPNTTIVNFVRSTANGELLEFVALNQQLLIKTPAIIDAIISNPYRTSEAERRVSEVKREFFEKERGARQIADELRARGSVAAAEFIENAEFAANLAEVSATGSLSFDDAILLAEHIEVPDAEIDDSWLALGDIEEFYEETDEQRELIVNKILGEMLADEDNEISGERVSLINRILRMTMKDRVKLAMKGDREARNILIRDPNRIVSQAVVANPRITEQEIEKIAAMRTVPEEVLRQIAISRAWARNYSIMHNLARNPRLSIGSAITILTRLQLRDLQAIAKNRNVSDAVRRQALRLAETRVGR